MSLLIERIKARRLAAQLPIEPILEELDASKPLFKPRSISAEHTAILFHGCSSPILDIAKELKRKGWRFYAVNQQRGRCYYHAKTITIPVWCFNEAKIGRKEQYIAHEIAHATSNQSDHNALFMTAMKAFCPQKYWHWEIGYKPTAAIYAGIVGPDF